MRFRVQVDPKQTATLVVEEARPILQTYQLTNLDSRQVELFVRQQSINKAVEDALPAILAQKSAVADLASKKTALEEEATKIFDDQQRLRTKSTGQLEKDIEALQEVLNRMIRELSIDAAV